jgi:hypothetical protein
MHVRDFFIVLLHRPQRAIEETAWKEHPALATFRVDQPRGADLDRFHDLGNRQRRTRKDDGVPRRGGVGQENPGGQQESVFLSPLSNELGQGLELGFRQVATSAMNPTGDEEKPVGQNQTTKARDAKDYSPAPSPEK